MKMLLVLSFEVPTPDDVVAVVSALDPPRLPHFAGEMNIVIEPHASQLRKWLDE